VLNRRCPVCNPKVCPDKALPAPCWAHTKVTYDTDAFKQMLRQFFEEQMLRGEFLQVDRSESSMSHIKQTLRRYAEYPIVDWNDSFFTDKPRG